MKVCIAEKPSVAREIANVLGAKSRKDGYFEGNGYQVTWTFGHFCTLWPPEDYKPHWKRWDLQTLPMLPEKFETKVMEDSGVKKQFKIIKSLFKNASLVINCGDAGQEGELIQRWVIKEAKYKGRVERLWISSLTTEAIKLGFNALKPASDFDSLYYAGSSRAIGDWLLGMNATRLYTLKYGGYKQVLSIGRVQTPTLAMLVARHHEINNFVSKPFWELQTIYRDTKFNNTTGKFFKKEDGEELLKKISGRDLTITNVSKKDGKEYAPKLFDLTSLQVYCNNKFGMSAELTLKTVQKLYEMKVVSYPRVDTTFLPNDMYPKVPGILKRLSKYEKFTSQLADQKIRKSTKIFNDKKVTDHHAIIPTGEQKDLTNEQFRVYDIITKRFIASFFPDCKVSKTEVKAEVENVKFVTKGKEILEDGWRVLFPKQKKKEDDSNDDNSKQDEENILPTFEVGEKGSHKPNFVEKATKPPKYYTEASLLRAMETAGKQVDDEELRDLMKANGIGRPSTRANIIETLFRRKYTTRRKKQVLPTEIGIQLIDTIQNKLLKSAELTGQWEKKLKEIENGTYNAAEFIQNMKKMVDDLVTEVRMEQSKPKIISQAPTKFTNKKSKKSNNKSHPKKRTSKDSPKNISDAICPRCKKGKILKGKASYGCTQWQQGCKFRMPFMFEGKKLTDSQVKRLVTKRATTKLKGFKINGEKTEGIIKLNANQQPFFEATQTSPRLAPNGMPYCPKCKKGVIIKGKTAYGCGDWQKGCKFRFSFADIKAKAKGKKLTKELVLKILAARG